MKEETYVILQIVMVCAMLFSLPFLIKEVYEKQEQDNIIEKKTIGFGDDNFLHGTYYIKSNHSVIRFKKEYCIEINSAFNDSRFLVCGDTEYLTERGLNNETKI